MGFLGYILIGILAGFLACKIIKGKGFGLLVNLLVGLLGGLVGGFLFGLCGIETTGQFIGSLFTSTIGAIVFLWILSRFKK